MFVDKEFNIKIILLSLLIVFIIYIFETIKDINLAYIPFWLSQIISIIFSSAIILSSFYLTYSKSFKKAETLKKKSEYLGDIAIDNEIKYSSMINAFDGLIYICSQDYRVEYMNQKLIKRTGYDSIGGFCYKVLHNLDQICPWCVNGRVFKGEIVKWEVQSPKDNRWFYVVNSPINHPDGSISKMALIEDITERKLSEKALEESEEKFSKAFNSNALAMSITSIEEGSFIEVNDAFLNGLGFTREEVIGKTSNELNVWVDESQRDELISIVKEKGSVSNYEATFRTKAGEIRYGLFSMSKIAINAKPYLLNIVNDITNYKEAEFKLKKSEKKYRTLIESANQVIFSLDNEGIFTYISPIIEQFSGYKVDEIIGKKFIQFVHPEDLLGLMESFKRSLSGKEEPYEFRIKIKDGSIHYVLTSSSLIMERNQQIGLMGIMIDITNRKKTELRLKESEEKFSKAFNSNALSMSITTFEEGRFIEANDVILNDLGFTREELIGKTSNELKIWVDESQRDDLISIVKEKGSVSNYEVLYQAKSGEIKHGLFSSSKITFNNKIYLLNIVNDITKIKKAELKLKESEKKFFKVFNNNALPMGIFTIDEGRVLDVNNKYIKDLGFNSKEDLIGKTTTELNIWHDISQRDKMIKIVKEKGKVNNFFIRANSKDKKLRYALLNVQKIFLDNEPYILTVINDITDLTIANQQLKESEEKYRNFVENSQEGVWALDANENTIFVNAQLCQMLGYAKDEILGKNLHYFLPKTMIPKIKSNKAKRERGIKESYELQLIKSNGSIVDVDVKAAPILDENQIYKGSFAYLTDITSKKVAQRLLRESEEKFRSIAEQSYLGILIVQNGKIIYGNKAWERIIGCSIKTMENWTIKDINDIFDKDSIEKIIHLYKSNIKGYYQEFNNFSIKLTTKTRGIKWIECYINDISFQGARASLISIVDISEKKAAIEIIKKELEKLNELNKMRQEIITRVSHELKTPLTSIFGTLQLILEAHSKELGVKSRKYINTAFRGCIRLKSLIDNLLDISRIEEQKFDLNFKVENLVEIIGECVNEMYYLADHRQITIIFDYVTEIYFRLDKIRFAQAITNLISNAIKNTPVGGEIYITLVENDQSIKISIRDTGIGLTRNEMSKLFQKFGKIERYGKNLDVDIEGTGLGLFICKEIIEMHKGKIEVRSEGRNKGSEFTVILSKTYDAKSETHDSLIQVSNSLN